LLWWRIPAYERVKITEATFAALQAVSVSAPLLRALERVVNQPFTSRRAYRDALAGALGPGWAERVEQEVHQHSLELATWQYGEIIGYRADGYLGQYLVILPRADLVATRMIRRKPEYNPDTDGFDDFVDCIRSMAECDETVAP
jgi:hypothetical protein